MTKLLLAQYKLEYETSDISIEDLANKYSIDISDLKGHEEWVKPETTLVPQLVTIKPQTTSEVKQTLAEGIGEFKELALEHCLKFMKHDAKFAEVKEFKDIVAIVDTLEKSESKTPTTGPTVNVLINNLTAKFAKEDV